MVTADPNPVAVGSNVDLTANVDDTSTGGSNIASAEYSVDGGGWVSLPAGGYKPDESLTGRANFGFVSKGSPIRPRTSSEQRN